MLPPADEPLALVFKSLGHPIRIWIVRRLAQGERCACELQAELGIAQPLLSQHLQVLKRTGVLGSRREGNRMIYRLRHPYFARAVDLAAAALAAPRTPTAVHPTATAEDDGERSGHR